MPSKLHLRKRWLAAVVGTAAVLGVGLLLFITAAGNWLQASSYDLSFLLHRQAVPHEVVIVYLDEVSHRVLDQPLGAPWDRMKHAQLLERLRKDGARVVVFDILFSDPGTNELADQALRDAFKAHGHVVLGGECFVEGPSKTLDPPLPMFREAAADWGLVHVTNTFTYLGVREHSRPVAERQTLAWAAAKVVGAPVTRDPAQAEATRWINYYGPAGTLPWKSYHEAYFPEGLPPETFRDKVVFVGAQQSTGFSGAGKDEYATAYTWYTGRFAPGVEIQATMFLNLVRQDWLTRMPSWLEVTLLALTALFAGAGFIQLRTARAAIVALAMMLLILVLAYSLFRFRLVWFAWLIPIAQIGLGLFWAIMFNTIQAYIETSVLERSLSLHLPVRRVKQILKQPELLALSAEKQEVSLLFTDIADWSTISERVTPERLFKLLNKYFQETIPCVHENEGMVLHLVGDAIFAVWNAPEPQKNHQELACAAALKLRDKLVHFESANESYPLRTRVGLHCGTASVGNCGSAERLVYTVLGAETNMASRLEGLNKHLGTEILASDRIVEVVEDRFIWRNLGRFKLKGADRFMEIYELVGALDTAETTHAWRQKFGDALRHFQRAKWNEAEDAFRDVIAMRGDDGPSRFYLRQIEKLRHGTLPTTWFGEVSMEEK